MALMLSKTYDALIDAGASPEKAREAAVEIASLDERLNRIDRRLIRLEIMVGAFMTVQIPITVVILTTLLSK